MTWLIVIGLAAAALAAAVLLFRLPRAAALSVASALLLGLAGYAWQGKPGLPGAPKEGTEAAKEEGPLLVEARKRFYRADAPPRSYLIMADGFARQGQFKDAADILDGALAAGVQDPEAWVALANVLVAHAEGNLAPPALLAFERAEKLDPGNLAPGFFIGVAKLRVGKLVEAHKAWSTALRNAPADAPGRAEMERRLAELEQVMRQFAAQG